MYGIQMPDVRYSGDIGMSCIQSGPTEAGRSGIGGFSSGARVPDKHHRHSGSATCVIRVEQQDSTVSVQVQDHGKGMSSKKLAEIQSKGSGVGIRGMRERLRQYKGTLNIESGPSGTIVMVIIPVPTQVAVDESKSVEPLQAAV